MATVSLTAATFEQTLTSNDIVFVDWWASWCGPCRMFAPIFESAAEANPDIVFGKVDTEAQPELAGAFQISSSPTLMAGRDRTVLHDGLVKSQRSGALCSLPCIAASSTTVLLFFPSTWRSVPLGRRSRRLVAQMRPNPAIERTASSRRSYER